MVDLDLTHAEAAMSARSEEDSILGHGRWLGRYNAPDSTIRWLHHRAIGSRLNGGIYNSKSEGINSRRLGGGVVCR